MTTYIIDDRQAQDSVVQLSLTEFVPEVIPEVEEVEEEVAEPEPEPEPEKEPEKEEKNEFMERMAKIKGIGPSRAKLLYESGYRSEEDLAKAGMEKVAKTKRMSLAMAELLFRELGIEEAVEEKEVPKNEAQEKKATPQKKLEPVQEMSENEFVKAITKIKGLGPSRARKIYRAGYHSIDALKNASVDELAKVPRMSRALAELVKEYVEKK